MANKKDEYGDILASAAKKYGGDAGVYGGRLDSTAFGEIDEYIDTGSYALNRLITGSIYDGIPCGKVVGFAGEPSTGKSYICGRIIKNAQKMDYITLYFDTEATDLKDTLGNIGVDLSKVYSFPVDGMEQFRNFAVNGSKELLAKNPKQKILIVLDSYANLSSAKELRDVADGKEAGDMGQRAKTGKAMFREMTRFCGKMKIPFIYTNHVYEKPAMNPMSAPTKVQSGGLQPTYMSSAVIFMHKRKDRDKASKKLLGNTLVCKSEKNRLCPEGEQVEMYLSFANGPNKYHGIMEDCSEAGLIDTSTKGYYNVIHLEKKLRLKELMTTYKKEVFTPEFLDKLDEYCRQKYAFVKIFDEDAEADDIVEDDDEN
jgi:RecA/RadA recombinase